MGSLSVPGIQHFPVESDLIIEMAVNKLDPLTLVIKVTSNSTDASLTLSQARITDRNKTVVAECMGQWVGTHEVVRGIRVNDGYYRPICRLQDFGSEKTLTLNFNTTLSSGNYALWFCFFNFPFAHTHFTIPRLSANHYTPFFGSFPVS